MTWLPMLFVGRGNQKELKPKPDPAQDVQPRFEKVCARPARPKPAEGTKQSNEHEHGAPATYRGHLTADEAATKTRE